MGEVALTTMAIANLGLFLVAGMFFNLWQQGKNRIKVLNEGNQFLQIEVDKLRFENEELLKRKQSLTQPRIPEQHNRKPLNSSQARARADQSNVAFFSAEKRVPNSEILKENSNG